MCIATEECIFAIDAAVSIDGFMIRRLGLTDDTRTRASLTVPHAANGGQSSVNGGDVERAGRVHVLSGLRRRCR